MAWDKFETSDKDSFDLSLMWFLKSKDPEMAHKFCYKFYKETDSGNFQTMLANIGNMISVIGEYPSFARQNKIDLEEDRENLKKYENEQIEDFKSYIFEMK